MSTTWAEGTSPEEPCPRPATIGSFAKAYKAGSATDVPPSASPLLHDVGLWIGRRLVVPCYRVRIHHRERIPATGPVVVVANHSAFVDGPLLFAILGRRAVFLVKEEMFRGLLGRWLRVIGQLPVRRGTAERGPLTAALGVLRGGGLVGIFPEGTRGTGDVVAAQQGAAWLARASGAQALPIVIRGTRPTGRIRFRPRVDVLVGEPLPAPEGKGRAHLAAATETIRAALAALVEDLDSIRSRT